MNFRTTRRVFLLSCGAALCGCQRQELGEGFTPISSGRYATEYTHALGAKVRLTLRADGEGAAPVDEVFIRAFDQLDELENIFSIYRPSSQLSQLNQSGELQGADVRLLELLDIAAEIYDASAGAFDPSVQPLWDAYTDAQSRGATEPNERQLAEALQLVGFDRWTWSREERWVRCHRDSDEGLSPVLTLNGIAQGYILDQTIQLVNRLGVMDALLDTGELGALGNGESGPWRLGIQHPGDEQSLAAAIVADGRCLATSGSYSTKFAEDESSHHLFHPQTGRCPNELQSVSVLAPTGAAADGLSTAVFVLGVEAGLELISSMPEVDAMLITADEAVVSTSGFPTAI